MRGLVIVLFAGACATVSLEQATRQATTSNQRAHDAAAARAAVDGEAFTPYAAPIAPIDGSPPLRAAGVALPGLADGETLYTMPDGTLALATADCVIGGSCGCELAGEYRFVRKPDKRVAVIRLRPDVHVREIHVASCGYGCGVPPPPIEPTARALGVGRPEDVELVDATYRYELVRETCDHPIPRP